MRARPTRTTDSCGKIRFATKDAAEVARAAYEKRFNRKYRVYPHRKCLGFHLTTEEK